MKKIENFKIVGIEIRTTNQNEQAAEDLGKLWNQFYSKNIPSQIPNKISDTVYSIYTDYESDYQGTYTTLIGLKVKSLADIPDGLTGREFHGGTYQKFVATGKMPNAVQEMWQEIWNKDEALNRKYTADFEVYGEKSQNGKNSEVDIFIAIS